MEVKVELIDKIKFILVIDFEVMDVDVKLVKFFKIY